MCQEKNIAPWAHSSSPCPRVAGVVGVNLKRTGDYAEHSEQLYKSERMPNDPNFGNCTYT